MSGSARSGRGGRLLLVSAVALGVFATLSHGQPGPVHPSDNAPSVVASASVFFVPATAHATGANGASWRTDLEVHNPGTQAASFTVQLLRRDADNANPPSKPYTLGAQASRRFPDVLLTEFGTEGAAALRIAVSSGTLVVTSRTYNLVGVNPWSLPQGASFGQYVPGWDETRAIGYGQEGRLIQLTHQASASLDGFRTNVGIVNATASPVDVRIDFYRADGTWLGKKDGGETNLPAWGFRQLNEVFGGWGTVPDGYAIVKTTTPGGKLLAFATVIDNHYSGDPIFVPAAVTAPASAPTPTPAPTATPTRTPAPTPTPTPPAGPRPNLILHQPAGWPSCFVAHSAAGCCSGTACCSPSLSTLSSAFIQVFLANAGTATLTGPVRLALAIDGVVTGYANWANSTGLEAGYGVILTWEYKNPVAPGFHDLTLTIDPDNTIPESSEADNSCTISVAWGGAPLVVQTLEAPAGTEDGLEAGAAVPVGGASRRRALGASGPVYVPASAHATGMNGANWRTDVEVHNPGTTAVTFSVELLRQGNDNGSGVPSKSFSLGPQQSVRYVDVLQTLFGFTGAASLRFAAQGGADLLVSSRTYNLIGANSVGLPVGASFGQYVPGLPETEAIGYGEEGRVIQLTHRDADALTDFRTNVGFVNATSLPIDLRIDLFTAAGTLLGTLQDATTRLRAFEFAQINGIFGTQVGRVEDGYVVVRTTTPGGRFFAFATVIDNHVTGDPIFVPAARLPGSTPPAATPTPGPTGDVVSGPAGATIAVPAGARDGGAAPTLSASDPAGLAGPGETVVSTAVRTTVPGSEPMRGNGSFFVTLPVTGSVPDPAKLVLKVQLADGSPYPVAGTWDAGRKTFTAELMSLWNDWKMAVVSSADLTRVLPQADVSALGWVTPDDWKTCAFSIVNHAPTVPAEFASATLPAAMKKVCGELRAAGFRSPKLWIDTRLAPNARVVHLVRGVQQPNQPPPPATHFEPCWHPGDPACDEQSAAFSTAGLTEDQMLALGQVYVNYDEIQAIAASHNVPLEGILIHELLHAVQFGYDFRVRYDATGASQKAYSEGTATLLGHTYEGNANGIFGGEVFLRPWKAPEPLDQRLDEYRQDFYLRQDFFGYVARRFTGGRLTNLRNLFQAMSDETSGKYGRTADEYLVLYRKAMDFWLGQFAGKGLSELYDDFALDRAYRHPSWARLRPSEAALGENALDPRVFESNPTWSPAQQPSFTLADVKPLSTATFGVSIPAAARSAGSLGVKIAVGNVALGAGGTRIRIFRERGGAMVPGGQIDVTGVSAPVQVPVGADVDALRVFVTNTGLENVSARVDFSVEGVSVAVSPAAAALRPGATQQFTATVTGSANTAVTWSVVEPSGGTVTSSGLYTAPATAGTYHVKATSQADATKSAQATVTVSDQAGVVVTISPTTATVETWGSVKFVATSSVRPGDMDLDFFVQEGTAGGYFGCCDVEGRATYTAPHTTGTYHVVARSKTDPTKSATATVTTTATFKYMQLSFQSEAVYSPAQYPLLSETITCGAAVSTSGPTRTCTWDKSAPGGRQWGQLTVTLDDSGSRILSFSGESNEDRVYPMVTETERFRISGSNVPWKEGGPNGELFETTGAETCSRVSSVSFSTRTYSLQSYSCTSTSSLRFNLSK